MSGRINGNPTKLFFINMITRDISTRDAILDLLDNSIDGASRINKDDYSGLWIRITLNRNEIVIEDNCGGFSLGIAQKYAFRFGRPEDADSLGATIGRFGVGMKRALFKMGNQFEVESRTKQDHFQIDVDVKEWKNATEEIEREDGTKETIENWNFEYQDITPDTSSNLEHPGTFIKVSTLYPEVAELFEDNAFLKALEDDIEKLLNFSLEKGIAIYFNEKELSKKEVLMFSDGTTPFVVEGVEKDVAYKVIAGLGETGDPSSSGWNIYCNDRLVLEANRDYTTGWGQGSIPKHNNNFAMFRGVVFLNADDPILLPLTTTKKGVDTSAEIYRFVLALMKEGMQHVITFLKEVSKLEDPHDYRITLGEQQEETLGVVELKNKTFEIQREFSPPNIDLDTLVVKKDTVRIQFSAKRKRAEAVKDYEGSKSYSQLGENLFEYYVSMEELDI